MTTKPQILSVAGDFSKYPAGRYRTDGPRAGEVFREDFMAPLLRKGSVRVILDGTIGYGSSFLEEAFGGLVRESGFTRETLEQTLVVEASDTSLVREVWEYICGASQRR